MGNSCGVPVHHSTAHSAPSKLAPGLCNCVFYSIMLDSIGKVRGKRSNDVFSKHALPEVRLPSRYAEPEEPVQTHIGTVQAGFRSVCA